MLRNSTPSRQPLLERKGNIQIVSKNKTCIIHKKNTLVNTVYFNHNTDNATIDNEKITKILENKNVASNVFK